MGEQRAVRNPQDTRRSILEAAESLFAERGFAGTTIREISRKSGASGPLILFHFQSKEGLYGAVKEEIVRRWEKEQRIGPIPDGSAREFVEGLVRSSFSFYRDNPDMVRIANWGRLEGDDEPWSGEEHIHLWYESSLRKAQRRGEIREDVSPMTVTAMIFGAVHIWWEFRGHVEEHVKQGSYEKVSDDDYLSQIVAVILKGLSPS